MRELLPLWVKVRFDHHRRRVSYRLPDSQWLAAAASLRPALVHASLCRRQDTLLAGDRFLSSGDIRELAADFKTNGMPRLIKPGWANEMKPLTLYL